MELRIGGWRSEVGDWGLEVGCWNKQLAGNRKQGTGIARPGRQAGYREVEGSTGKYRVLEGPGISVQRILGPDLEPEETQIAD